MRGAITGACMFEGWAKTPEDAVALADGGELGFESCHDHGAAGPMSGIITPSMWVYVVRNESFGNQAFPVPLARLSAALAAALRRPGGGDAAAYTKLAAIGRGIA